MIEYRPWGSYTVLYECPTYKIKEITILPNARPSYQYHNYRSELWYIIDGQGQLLLDGEIINLNANDYIYIPIKSKHRIFNNNDKNLVFIEIQLGDICSEDDIVRIEDDYGR